MTAKYLQIQNHEPVVAHCTAVLRQQLQAGKRVLWLVSGGSVIPVAVAVAQKFTGIPVGKLTVSLTDERPGPVGHPDSNWLGLQQAGLQLPGATLRPILTGA